MASAPQSFLVVASIWVLAALAAFATGLAAAADRYWLGDMITFFVPQLVLVLAILVGVAAILRRWFAAGAFAMLLAINAAPLTFAAVPTAPAADARTLRVMSANLLFDNASPQAFADQVAVLGPDVLVTQEARFDWPDLLRKLPGYPYMVGPELYRLNSNLVVSRYPLRAQHVAGMPDFTRDYGGGQALRVEVDLPDRTAPLVVYAIHAPTPRTLAGWQARRLYLDAIAAQVAAEPPGTPILLAGDWNTPVWSPAYARTLMLSGLEATERSPWPPATRLFLRLGGETLLGTPIDHVAVSPGIGVAGLGLGRDFGSDHLPVVIDLKLP
jgi:endonuclease/exonuclease/phosphatase (EEP) superfamily protein YafD